MPAACFQTRAPRQRGFYFFRHAGVFVPDNVGGPFLRYPNMIERI